MLNIILQFVGVVIFQMISMTIAMFFINKAIGEKEKSNIFIGYILLIPVLPILLICANFDKLGLLGDDYEN